VNVFLQLYRQRQLLMVANAQLLEADQRKNEFLAVLSHELRTPWRHQEQPLHPQPCHSRWGAGPPRPGGDRAPGTQLSNLVDEPARRDPYHAQQEFACRKQRLDLNQLVHRAVEDNRSFFERNEVRLSCELAPTR